MVRKRVWQTLKEKLQVSLKSTEFTEHCLILRIPKGNLQKRKKSLEGRGGVAQLGEHLPCKQGVRSSILLISTTGRDGKERRKD